MLLLAGLDPEKGHDTGRSHPERPARIPAAAAALADVGLDGACVLLGAREATVDELTTTHRGEYVEALRRFCAEGPGQLDPDTPVEGGSWDAALRSAGAGLAAVDALAAGQGEAAFVLTRPPGHHARPAAGMGFCLFNNVAVAATRLAAAGNRVAIVDWDVHHGNGTQEIFWDDARVLYVSLHQANAYPFTGTVFETGGEGAEGTTVNIPLPARTTGDVVLGALDDVVVPAIDGFGPDWLLVSAGYDAHRADPLADIALSAGDFADIARRVLATAPAPGRTVLFLEGGYDLEALRLSVGATLGALTGTDYRPEAATSGGPGAEALAVARR